MMSSIRALLSDDISWGEHYVHFIILAAQHIGYASTAQTCFFFFIVAKGFRTLYLWEQHYGFGMDMRVYACVYVSRLMTTGIGNATD